MEKEKVNLSIIILFFKEKEDQFINLLKSLEELSNFSISYEIIIINNSSKNLNLNFKNTFFINNNKNLGVATSRNQGALISKGEVLLFLDADVIVLIEDVLRAYNYLIKNKNIDGLGLESVSLDGKVLSKFFKLPSFWFIFFEIFCIEKKYKRIIDPKMVEFVSGGTFMVKRFSFFKVGLFDEKFSLYGWEDTDWFKRAKKLNLVIFYYPYSKIIHLMHTSSKATSLRSVDFYFSSIYYYKKHFGKILAFFVLLFILFFSFLRLIINIFKKDKEKNKQLLRLIKGIIFSYIR